MPPGKARRVLFVGSWDLLAHDAVLNARTHAPYCNASYCSSSELNQSSAKLASKPIAFLQRAIFAVRMRLMMLLFIQ